MEKNKKTRHALTNKAPIIAMLIWLVVVLALQTVFGLLLAATGLFASNKELAQYFGVVVGSIVFLLIMKFWYRPDYEGACRPGLSMKKALIATLPVVALCAAALVYQLILYHYWEPSFEKFAYALSAGVGEEVMFRAALIPIAMGFYKSEKRVWLVPLLTGLFFGCTHLANVAGGASVVNGIIQALATTMIGVYFGALIVATGTVIPGIVMHTIYDFICFAGDPGLTDGIMTSALPALDIAFNLITTALLMAVGFIILKKVGAPEILRLWQKKWSRD